MHVDRCSLPEHPVVQDELVNFLKWVSFTFMFSDGMNVECRADL